MKRDFLFTVYQAQQGKLLQAMERKYLKHAITVSCKQTVVQVGYLGWESTFVDCSFFQKYTIVDTAGKGCADAAKIQSKLYRLPIRSEVADLVIVPHLLEFDNNRLQTLREIERVLKPEGEIIILNFNPLNLWLRWHNAWHQKTPDSRLGNFIFRQRILDWLALLNFEIKATSELTLDTITNTSDSFNPSTKSFSAMTYAVQAIKRQYTLIPLTQVKIKPPRLTTAVADLKATPHRKST